LGVLASVALAQAATLGDFCTTARAIASVPKDVGELKGEEWQL
jgi:hypothetical protein